jgi:hypothetical protein
MILRSYDLTSCRPHEVCRKTMVSAHTSPGANPWKLECIYVRRRQTCLPDGPTSLHIDIDRHIQDGPPPNHHPLHHRPPSSLRPELQRRLAPTSLLLTYPRTFQPADNGSLNPQRPKSREPRCSWWAVECIYAKTVLAV